MVKAFNVNKVVVLGLKRIGDAVYTLPVFEAIKSGFPAAQIDVITEPQVKDIYTANPYITHCHVFSKQTLWSASIAHIKQSDYDVCVVLHSALKYALIPFLARVPVRIGYINELRGGLLTHKLALPKAPIHRIEHNARLLDFLGVDMRPLLPKLYFSDQEQLQTEALLQKFQLNAQGYVVFIVGSIAQTRRWFPQNFAEAARRISAELGLRVLILGGPDDVGIANNVMAHCGDEVAILNLAGKTALRETLLFMQAAKAVVSNDTGPMHAASAIGVPVITWFGAANEAEIAPPSPNTRLLNAHVPCSPCVKESCPYQLECLTAITPDWVMTTLKEAIA